jgi:hypothetical protein
MPAGRWATHSIRMETWPVLAPLLLLIGSLSVPTTSLAAAAVCTDKVSTTGFHESLQEGTVSPLGALPDNLVSVPTWSGAFTTDGRSYPYVMVGTDPALGSATVSVPVAIVPLRLDFAATNCVLEDSTLPAEITSSPMFRPTPFATGTTQYLDAIQRGSFWSAVSSTSPEYHLLLATPSVVPTQTLHVPAVQGLTALNGATGKEVGIVGGKWLSIALQGLINELHVDPGALALFVADNVYVTDSNPAACLVSGCGYYIGYHAATFSDRNAHAINTYAFASLRDFGNLLPPGLDARVSVVSHEILEWAADPFVRGTRVRGQVTVQLNTAPAWTSQFYGGGAICSEALEVADPIEEGPFVGAVPIGGSSVYLLADAAFLSWFARESPSTAFGGRYDALGVLNGVSAGC